MHPTARDDFDLAALEGKESRNPYGSRQTSTPSFTDAIRSMEHFSLNCGDNHVF